MKAFILSTIAVFAAAALHAKEPVSIGDICESYVFYAQNSADLGLKPTPSGTAYTAVSSDGRSITMTDFATGKQTTTLFDVAEIENCPISTISDYELSPLESHLLIATSDSAIYRHSTAYFYYIYDIKYKTLTPLREGERQQCATFSPNGALVAYVHRGNLYVYRLKYNSTLSVTTDGSSTTLNGIADWLSEEEFAVEKAFAWSPDSKELAYLRYEQENVGVYELPHYGDWSSLNQPIHSDLRYPKAGTANATISANVFHIDNKTTKTMQAELAKDFYLTEIFWTGNARELGVVRCNRRQSEMNLLLCNAASTVCNAIMTDRNKSYVDMGTPGRIVFLPSGTDFLYLGELDGWNHIWLYGTNGVQKACLTKGEYDVTKIIGYSAKTNSVIFQAAKESPLQREVYSASIDGKTFAKISTSKGTNDAQLSSDGSYLICDFSNSTTPTVVSIADIAGKTLRTICTNDNVKEAVDERAISQRTFMQIPMPDGEKLNAWLTRPLNFDPSQSYPLVIYQYSGPNMQVVLDEWNLDWEQVLAAEGYATLAVDTRGTGARGEEFRKQTYQKIGIKESDDLIATAEYMAQQSYIDGERIGLWGWSFGGFSTALTMCRTSIFKAGIAVAGVYDWRLYDTAYTERIMRKPDENPSGYDASSVLQKAENLSGRILLIHGTADDNVHVQNQMALVDALVQSNKQFDMFTYPDRNHNIAGGNTRTHLYTMMTQFIKRNL